MPHNHPSESDFPKISVPAIQALNNAGYYRLEQLTTTTEEEIRALHGMGPKGLDILRQALHEKGWTFARK